MLARQLDDLKLTASLLLTLAGGVSDRDEARAQGLYDELLAFIEQHGEERFPTAFVNLADFALRHGDYASAEHYSEQSVPLLRQEGDTWSTALALGNLGLALLGLGKEAEACERLAESMRLFESVGDRYGIAVSLSSLASVAADRGETGRATRLLAQADHLLGEIEAEPAGVEKLLHEQTLARVRAECKDFESEWARGQAMTVEEAVAEAVGMSACTTSADASPNES